MNALVDTVEISSGKGGTEVTLRVRIPRGRDAEDEHVRG
jgi:hypothetical protein